MTEDASRLAYEFELGYGEQVRASRVMSNRQFSTRLFHAVLVVSVVLVVGLDLRARAEGRLAWPLGIPLILAIAATGFAAIYFTPFLSVRNLRQSNRAAAGPHTYSFHAEGLDVVSPGARATIEWANFSEVYESREFLLLYISRGQAALLPKRVVADLHVLRGAFRRWVGQRAHLQGDGPLPEASL